MKRGFFKSKIFLFLITFGFSNFVHGETPGERELLVKAALIFQFTKFFEWPNLKGDFVINVIEDEPLATYLTKITSTKTVSGHAVVIRQTDVVGLILKPGQMVIYPKKVTDLFFASIEKLSSKPCLTVGHGAGMAKGGAAVNFVEADGKLRFELNLKSINKVGLKIDPKLIELGIVVE